MRELRRIDGGAHDLRSAAVPLDILLQWVENSRALEQIAEAGVDDEDVVVATLERYRGS